MTFTLSASLRRMSPQRRASLLKRRADDELPMSEAGSSNRELLLDTGVYLDVLQRRAPEIVKDLLAKRQSNHSTVALAELTHRFGRLDPSDARTPVSLREIGGVIAEIPAHRLSAPSARACGEAGMLAGLVARLTGRGGGIELLNDALLFLQAREDGRVLLTANLADFDWFDQLLPGSGLLFYRPV